MNSTVRPVYRALLIFVVSLVINFAAFLMNYRLIAFPFLSEEQRVANAGSVLTMTLASYAIAALLVAGIVYWVTSNDIRTGRKNDKA